MGGGGLRECGKGVRGGREGGEVGSEGDALCDAEGGVRVGNGG